MEEPADQGRARSLSVSCSNGVDQDGVLMFLRRLAEIKKDIIGDEGVRGFVLGGGGEVLKEGNVHNGV